MFLVSPDEPVTAEEESDLLLGVLGRVGGVDRVSLLRFGVEGPNGPLLGLRRIGGPDGPSKLGYGVVGLEDYGRSRWTA